MNKEHTRSQLLQQRRKLGHESQKQHSKTICEKIMHADFYRNSKQIAAYVALGREVDCTLLFEHIFSHQDKKLYLPVMAEGMQFYEYQQQESFSYNHFNFAEPPVADKQAFDVLQLDLIILPLVGFDEQGNRIGRGAGHYDRILECAHQKAVEKRPLLVGVAYQFQKVSTIEADEWDIPLDYVITE
ncbi:MAG: 5-formyltetrahydrofolate cyclo-ligase [Gammaproteobacteria bacterium]|nr:5-formyltetrahydrofolate cyclo-ligase [Gammaproteobacteria bacterium]